MINSGYQCALMAPTEILAIQHYENFKKLLPNVNIELLTGSVTKKKKEEINYKLKNNDRVRIVTSTLAEGPNESWLDIVITASAKRKIRDFIAKNSQVLTFEKKG